MLRLLHSRWLWALVLWTALIAVQVVLLAPGASAPRPACNYAGGVALDPSLPTCPPDDFNDAAVSALLLVFIWLAGVGVGLLALAISRFVLRSSRGA